MSRDVIRYYDANTRRFLRHGHGKSASAIHRAVWAEGVENRREAMEYINRRIAARLRESASASLLDIGCGVGGSLRFIAKGGGIRAVGLTISSVQAEIGRRLLAEEDCSETCSIITADFLDPTSIESLEGPFDTAIAVESLLHMEDPARFFSHAARLLSARGELIICDDILRSPPTDADPTATDPPAPAEALLRRFREGWHAEGLRSRDELVALAAEAGFELQSDEDLTAYLELDRPRDRLIRLIVAATAALPLRSPFWRNLRGGDALQSLLRRGDLSYRLLRFHLRTGMTSTANLDAETSRSF